jgi:hypothetical protein
MRLTLVPNSLGFALWQVAQVNSPYSPPGIPQPSTTLPLCAVGHLLEPVDMELCTSGLKFLMVVVAVNGATQ